MGTKRKRNNHHRKTKRKLRGSRGFGRPSRPCFSPGTTVVVNHTTTTATASTFHSDVSRSSYCCDLFVTLPKPYLSLSSTTNNDGSSVSSRSNRNSSTSISMVQQQLQIQDLIERFQSTGYTDIALTHVIYGRPSTSTTTNNKLATDAVDNAIPRYLYSNIPTRTTTSTTTRPPIRILRRLHAIVETVSDVALYHNSGNNNHNNNNNNINYNNQETTTQQQLQQQFLQGYDLISLGPTNDATFQAACRHAMAVDIVTVDYTQRVLGWKLPYQIQSQDLQALIDRGASLEICLAPALLNVQHRKSLIHACREIFLACQSLTTTKYQQQHHQHQVIPPIIVSSGNRTLLLDQQQQHQNDDVGALALRLPGDLQTLAKTLLGFPPALVGGCMSTLPAQIIQHGYERKHWGVSSSSSSIRMAPKIQILHHNNNNKTTTTSMTTSTAIKEKTTMAEKESGGNLSLASRGNVDHHNNNNNNNNNDDDDDLNDHEHKNDGFIAI
jgi:RNase P/RNase MRP subunit p30